MVIGNVLDHRYRHAEYIQSLSTKEGLSQSAVYDIIEDSDGYIWLATEDSLNRFDGYSFTRFKLAHFAHLLDKNVTITLQEEPGEGIWLGTQHGLIFFNFKTEKFTHYSNDKGLQTRVHALARMSSGKLYIGSDNGLFVFNKALNQISPVLFNDKSTIETPINALEVADNQLWIASTDCIYSTDESGFVLKSHCEGKIGDKLGARKSSITALKISNNQLWIGTRNGLLKWHLKTQHLQRFTHEKGNRNSLIANWIQGVEIDHDGNPWVGSAFGLSFYDVNSARFKNYDHKMFQGEAETAGDILSVYIDHSGLLWVGTDSGGVTIVNPKQSGFKHVLTKSDLFSLGIDNSIHGIEKDSSEQLWLANYGGGLINLNLMTGKVTRPFHSELNASGINAEYVYALLIDYKNRLWVGTRRGLALIDLNAWKLIAFKAVKDNQVYQFDQFIYQIYEDHLGAAWIATSDGLFKVKSEEHSNGALILTVDDKLKELPMSFRNRSKIIRVILETRDGNIWIGGKDGLLFFSIKSSIWRHFEYDIENVQSISNNDIQAIFEDSRGILWVATLNGLNKVVFTAPEEVYFERITKEKGLPSNTIYGILEDNYKQLWLSTNLGLVRYSDHTNLMRPFRIADGLSSNEFNQDASFTDSSGVLYFGSINGVTVIERGVQAKKNLPSRLKITELTVGQRKLNVYELNRSKRPKIIVKKNESAVILSVAELYYANLASPSYRYRLTGEDDSWLALDDKRTIVLTGLTQGIYKLEVQSKIAGSSWPTSFLEIEVAVAGEFFQAYKLWYLFGVLLLSVCCVVIGLARHRRLQSVAMKQTP